jgi:Rieske Fe-S protein
MRTSTRRTLLTGAGAVGLATVLSGCAAYGLDSATPGIDGKGDDGTSDSGTGADGRNADGTNSNGTQNGDTQSEAAASLAKTGDIPVGGGKIFADRKIVITQPTAGTFRCFTAVCTHAGCIVGEVARGTINCPCHGSRFKTTDGTVTEGPAKKPLKSIAINVTGDAITKA